MNVLKKYFIAYSFVLIDFLFVATFDNEIKKKWQKSDKHFKLVSPKSIVRVLFMRFELPLTPNTAPSPPNNISNGPYDQYVVVGWLLRIRLSRHGDRWDDLLFAIMLAT